MSAKIITLLSIGLLSLFTLVAPVSAHVLKTDGSIGAVLHIDPEDDPIAGEPATFFFEFRDRQNKFDPKQCDCKVSITSVSTNQQLFSQPLFTDTAGSSLNSPSLSYIFPSRDVYTIAVDGKPTTANAFQPFRLAYDIRVERQSDALKSTSKAPVAGTQTSPAAAKTNTTGGHWLHFLAAGIVVVVFLVFLILDRLQRRRVVRPQPQPQSPKSGPPLDNTASGSSGGQVMSCVIALVATMLVSHSIVTDIGLLNHDKHDKNHAAQEEGDNHRHPCCATQNATVAPQVIIVPVETLIGRAIDAKGQSLGRLAFAGVAPRSPPVLA